MHKVWLGTSSVVLAAIMTATSVGASATQVFAAENELLLDTAEEETAEEDLVVDFEEVQDTTEEGTAEDGEEVFLEESDELDGESADDESAELEETGTASEKGYSKVKNLVGTDFELGAASFDIMYGSNIVTKDGVDYYALPDGIYSCAYGEESLILKVKDAENLNVLDGKVFFTTYKDNKAVLNVFDLETAEYEKTLEIGDEWINQMYAVNDGSCLLLIEGTIYKLNLNTYSMIRYIDETDVFNFTPTKYGIVFAKGSSCNYTVYFNNVKILSDVENYYVDGENLIISNDGEDYEISMSEVYRSKKDKFENRIMSLNETDTVVKSNVSDEVAAQVTVYDKTALILPEEESSIIAEADMTNALDNAEQISEEDFIEMLNSVDEAIANGEVSDIDAEEYEVEPSTVNEITVGTGTGAFDLTKEMVKRAQDIYNTTWIAQKEIPAFVGNSVNENCKANQEVHGIPYGQPLKGDKEKITGSYYTLFNMTFEDFLNKAKEDSFELYDPNAQVRYWNTKAEKWFYSQKWTTDCSAFVSYCWGIGRNSTSGLPGVSTEICAVGELNEEYKNIQIGDAFNYPGSHVMLVTGVNRDSHSKILTIDIIEQTPPHTMQHHYTLAQLFKALGEDEEKGKKSKYKLYRSNKVADSGEIVIEDEEGISVEEDSVSLYKGQKYTIKATVSDGLSAITYTPGNKTIATVDKNGIIKAVAPGKTTITLSAKNAAKEPFTAKVEVEVKDISVSITPANVTSGFYIGQTMQLSATVIPEGTLTWKSSKPEIVKVSNDGVITALKKGTAIITVTGTTKEKVSNSAKCVVTVKKPYVTASVSRLGPDFYKGQTKQLTASVVPGGTIVDWVSSDKKVVTVKDGLVTAVGAGKASITVKGKTLEGKNANPYTISVNVTKAALIITPGTISAGFYTGKTYQLSARIEPAGTVNSWKSSKPSVVQVTKDGLLKAVKSGTATITVTGKASDGTVLTKTCAVTVSKPKAVIEPSVINAGFYEGQTKKLALSFTPADAQIKDVKWTSDDKKIVTVTQNGTIKGIKKGNATITVVVNANGESVKKTCSVTVSKPVASISPSVVDKKFYVGETKKLEVSFKPSVVSWEWKTSDPKVVTVSHDGIIKGIGVGSATVSVKGKTSDGIDVPGKCVVTVSKPYVTISPSTIPAGFYTGQKRQLTAKFTPSGTVTEWKSNKPSIVAVDKNTGMITALKNGSATITVTGIASGIEVKKTCAVTVLKPSVDIVFPGKKEVYINHNKQLKANFTPEGKVKYWKTSDSKILRVSTSGEITGVSKGEAKVIVVGDSNGTEVTGEYTVTVLEPYAKITPENLSYNFYINDTKQLSVTIVPDGTVKEWRSSKESVVTVSGTGLVTAKRNGSATITVTAESNGYKVSHSCPVEVKKPKVEIGAWTNKIYEGDEGQLKVSFIPSGAIKEWKSLDTSIVTVDKQTGWVKCHKSGMAKIKYVADYKGYSWEDTYTINILEPQISIPKQLPKGFYINGQRTIGVTYTPSAAGWQTSWSSSDTSIVTVDNNGTITGKKVGSAYIIVTGRYKGGSKKTSQCYVTVNKPSVSISPSIVTINEGEEKTLTATFTPSGKVDSWSSSNYGKVTVDKSGKIKGISEGTEIITVRGNYNGYIVTGQCKVTVKKAKPKRGN